MIDFAIHPDVYSVGRFSGLMPMLEDTWIKSHTPGDGVIYLISGFANFNGGARFYKLFKEHTELGGKIVSFLGGSTSQRLSSKQVVEALLECGSEVHIINRKRLLHSKCYGIKDSKGQKLIVTSGNFTGPGMSQNVESAILLGNEEVSSMSFQWEDVELSIKSQKWQIHTPNLLDLTSPAWKLLYDESSKRVALEETETVTLLILLGKADTARIQAEEGTKQGLGSQYFWLSKDSFSFFPSLNIKNKKGWKGTLSTMIKLRYVDLNLVSNERVTFEAENNLDFRLGTGKLRYSKVAASGDIACISRVEEDLYELRIFKKGSIEFNSLQNHAINYIGHQGKRYGYIDNSEFEEIAKVRLNKQ